MSKYQDLMTEAKQAAQTATAIAAKAKADGDRELTGDEAREFRAKFDEATKKKARADGVKQDDEDKQLLARLSAVDDDGPAGFRPSKALNPSQWARKAAEAIGGQRTPDGAKAITSGSYSLPAVLVDAVQDPQKASSVLSLIPVKEITSNDYAYLRQTVRTTNATAVADHGLKPTSIFAFDEFTDRARVVAHVSEPFPARYLQDHDEAVRMLESEMGWGTVTATEQQVLSGDGTGENMTGVLSTTGVLQVPFATSVPVTLRKARTALQVRDEVPNAWVLNPVDAEALDLLREDETAGTGDFLSLARILGDIPFVTSNGVPAGTAILGDWAQTRAYARENSRLDVDAGGALFDRNELKLRGEVRIGFAVLRPGALAIVDLTAV